MDKVACPVCLGGGVVVWENGLPRAPNDEAEWDNAEECPACDATGDEPNGARQ